MFEVAGFPAAQEAEEVMMHLTASPFTKVVLVKTLLLFPLLIPFTCHWNVGEEPPFKAEAVKVMAFPAHTVSGFTKIFTDTDNAETTDMVIEFEAAGLLVEHMSDDVMIQVTTSPLPTDVAIKADEFVPAMIPFNCHWYTGLLPPLMGVAVNVTLSPEQMLFPGLAEIFIPAGINEFTAIVIAFEIAGEPVTQFIFAVISQVMISPFASKDVA
jgi:hypothetical protein